MPGDAPLDSLRVVDLADEKGELCGRLLADLGADVVRVEPPGGARSRRLPPFHAGASLYFAHRNSNKRGLCLDLEAGPDRERLHRLLAGADVLVESTAPGRLAALGLAPAALLERHPHLVVTSITDFGQTGPYRDWVATDAVLEAMGGMQWKAGLPDRPPLLPPAPLAYDVAGVAGAWASLLACHQRRRGGRGQHLDVAVLEAVAQTTDWSLSNASVSRQADPGYAEVRMGSGPLYPIYACKSGYVRVVILSPRQWHAMREWLGDPEYLRDPSYDSFLGRLAIAEALYVMISDHFASMGHEEVAAEAQRRGIVCTPVLRPEEVLANEHFRSRGTTVDAEVAPGIEGPAASGYFEIDGVRQGFRRRAPTPDEHREELGAAPWEPRTAPGPRAAGPALPLEGLRVLDFGIGGVGVEGGRLFGEYGADVIKIESRSYPDFIRVVMGTEMGASFASSSRTKRGFGVNLKTDEGLRLLRELVRQADVVIENNSTGTMDELGLGWETLRELNPRCVMLSSQLLGSRGAFSDWIGYGPNTQPIGGLVHLWNYADREAPAGSTSIFPDHLAGRLCFLAGLALLWRREKSGAGGHAEVAQAEAVTNTLGDLLLKAGLEPGSVRPVGNASERGAPWGAYPCRGEQQWCVVCVRDDDEWRALCRALGDPAWALAPALASAAGRLAARDQIDERLGAFTRERDKGELAALLQAHGVPAGPMLTGCGQLDDPHLQERGYPCWLAQQDLGRMAFEGPAFRGSGMGEVRLFQAPRLGEHTREIGRELLGLSDAEIDRLVAQGVLEVPRPEPGSDGGGG